MKEQRDGAEYERMNVFTPMWRFVVYILVTFAALLSDANMDAYFLWMSQFLEFNEKKTVYVLFIDIEQQVPVVKELWVRSLCEQDIDADTEDQEDQFENTAGLEIHCTADHSEQHTHCDVLKEQ